MIDRNLLARHPATLRAEQLLREQRLAAPPGVTPLVALTLAGLREGSEVEEYAAGLLRQTPGSAVSLLVPDYERLQAEAESLGEWPALDGQLRELLPDLAAWDQATSVLTENLLASREIVYPASARLSG